MTPNAVPLGPPRTEAGGKGVGVLGQRLVVGRVRSAVLGAAPPHPAARGRPPAPPPAPASSLLPPAAAASLPIPLPPRAACRSSSGPERDSGRRSLRSSSENQQRVPHRPRDPAPSRASSSFRVGGCNFPGPGRGRDGSGTTWKTSLGRRAGSPGASGRGCKRAVTGPWRPPTS